MIEILSFIFKHARVLFEKGSPFAVPAKRILAEVFTKPENQVPKPVPVSRVRFFNRLGLGHAKTTFWLFWFTAFVMLPFSAALAVVHTLVEPVPFSIFAKVLSWFCYALLMMWIYDVRVARLEVEIQEFEESLVDS